MPNKIDILIENFHNDVASIAENRELLKELITRLCAINPYFEPIYSIDHFGSLDEEMVGQLTVVEKERLLVMANIYAAIYVPLIHGFAYFVLERVKQKSLPNSIMIPPRDPIPINFAMQAQAGSLGMVLNTVTPAMNRKISGVPNNQVDDVATMDPLFPDYVKQEIAKLGYPTEVIEIEPGVYSTTSLLIAQYMNDNGHKISYIPVKLYARGPNISYTHWLLTQGQTTVAEVAEADTDIQQLTEKIMVILDTLEEFGAQNAYKSPQYLTQQDGEIMPQIIPNSTFDMALAALTNASIIHTTNQYLALTGDSGHNGLHALAYNILLQVDTFMELANVGIPVVFKEPIPAMDNKEEHYQKLRVAQTAGVINYQKLEP